MITIMVKGHMDKAIKRFLRKTKDVVKEARLKSRFESKADKRRRKQAAARKRDNKKRRRY